MDLLIILLKSMFLGVVEGVTEFLPISSTGHLIIFDALLKFKSSVGEDFANSFEVIIQLGAIFAVMFYYKDKIINSLKNIVGGGWGFKLWVNVVIGVIPAGLIGFIFRHQIKLLFSPEVVGVSLIVGGVLLLLGDRISTNHLTTTSISTMRYRDAIIIGFFQLLSLIPGMSRSGTSIVGGLFRGLKRTVAAEFSFFMAMPIMVMATVLELSSLKFSGGEQVASLIFGFLVSFIVAYIVIKKFLDYLGKHDFKLFAYYRFFVGVVILLYAYFA